jgi:hypothetical protein
MQARWRDARVAAPTHERRSYLARMKRSRSSIVAEGRGFLPRSVSDASYTALKRTLPTEAIKSTYCGVHVSSVVDLTRVICVPRLRCIPEQSMQKKQPRLKLAHLCAAGWG